MQSVNTCIILLNPGNDLASRENYYYPHFTDELRLREVNALPKVTELVSGRDVVLVTDPGWFVCLHSPLTKLAPAPWPVVKM